MARPELPVQLPPFSRLFLHFGGRLAPAFQPPAKNALLFFVWLWYIGLGIVKAALKSSIFLFFLEQLCFSTYPRKGTETLSADSDLVELLRFQLIPAKGTETFLISDHLELTGNFNLSPQGDGNLDACPHNHGGTRISTYPRKGTETSRWSGTRSDDPISAYPRKGDGNIKKMIPDFTSLNYFNLSPQRGRKPNQIVLSRQALAISTYPRKNPLRRCAPALPKGAFRCHLPCTKLPLSGELAGVSRD